MSLSILFPDGSKITGTNATHILMQLMGGWNPDESIYQLRRRLAWRHGIVDDPELSDMEFLHELDRRGAWSVGYLPKGS
jgi:hypothetical protein